MTFQIAKMFTFEKGIDLGFDVHSNSPRELIDRHLADAYLLSAMTGYGKSRLLENFCVQLAEERRLLVFDARGEHKNLRMINAENKDGKGSCIPGLVYIERFGFKLEQFQNPQDWAGLGFGAASARICSQIAKQVGSHKNDFDVFLEMLDEVPTKGKGKDNEFYATMLSAKSKLKSVKNCFVDNNSIDITRRNGDLIRFVGIPFYISDWKVFLTYHRHVCINFNSENNPAKAQFFAGKILNDIKPIINSNNPFVIAMEEAHFLFPAEYNTDTIPYSAELIYHYLKSKHKDSVKIILVTQYPAQLNDSALDEIKWYFIGKLEHIEGKGRFNDMFRKSDKLN